MHSFMHLSLFTFYQNWYSSLKTNVFTWSLIEKCTLFIKFLVLVCHSSWGSNEIFNYDLQLNSVILPFHSSAILLLRKEEIKKDL